MVPVGHLRGSAFLRHAFPNHPHLGIPIAKLPHQLIESVSWQVPPNTIPHRRVSERPYGFEVVPSFRKEPFNKNQRFEEPAYSSNTEQHTTSNAYEVVLKLLRQKVGVFLEGEWQEGVVLPELGAEVSVGCPKGVENGLDEITHRTGVTARGRVAIGDSGHAHELLSGG